MPYIYKITNIINNKSYIGLTKSENPNDRWEKHRKDYKYSTEKPLYRAFQKYGIENFLFEVLEKVESEQNLSDREIYYIQKYDSYNNGYNATLGGDGGRKIAFSSYEEENQLIELFKSGYSCRKIGRILGRKPDTISKKLKSLGFIIETKFTDGVKIQQLSLDEKVLANFVSGVSAAKAIGKTAQESGKIIEVCKGKRKTAYGYIWRYMGD